MSLDYHLVDPLGDDEKDEQQSDVLDGGWSGVLGWKVGQEVPNLSNSFLIPRIQHDVWSHNDAQMSLDYHLVDPLGDDEKDEQQSDMLDGGWSGGIGLKSWTRRAKYCQQLFNPSNPAWRTMPQWCWNELGLSSGRLIGRWWKRWAAIWCVWCLLIRRFWAESWTRSAKYCQQLANPSNPECQS
jgi:hypothetical protein